MTAEQITLLVGTVGGLVVSVLVYRQSKKVDAISAQSGIVDSERAGIAQQIAILNDIADNLLADNKAVREQVRYLTARLDAATNRIDELQRELTRLRRKYGNGD